LQHLQDIKKADETEDILERTAFKSDESDMHLNILVKSTEEFLKKYMNLEKIQKYRKIENFLQENCDDYEPLCISLSGGVDSMVIAKILVHLKNTGIKLLQ
jgi:asparagine synthetase B (glutamine-hydrolysing)